jgi:8-oxo-dGTP pyrophosphatase MutT (NUDIX family)
LTAAIRREKEAAHGQTFSTQASDPDEARLHHQGASEAARAADRLSLPARDNRAGGRSGSRHSHDLTGRIRRFARRLLHRGVYGLHRLRRSLWFFTKPRTSGVHAVAFTPDGKLILVTLSYARGWRLPGGGRKRGESAEEAIRRELREEIGMTSCGALRPVARFSHRPDYRNDRSSLFVVEDVVFRPRWSLEIKAVQTFDREALPADMAPITKRLIAAASRDSAPRQS